MILSNVWTDSNLTWFHFGQLYMWIWANNDQIWLPMGQMSDFEQCLNFGKFCVQKAYFKWRSYQTDRPLVIFFFLRIVQLLWELCPFTYYGKLGLDNIRAEFLGNVYIKKLLPSRNIIIILKIATQTMKTLPDPDNSCPSTLFWYLFPHFLRYLADVWFVYSFDLIST